MLWQVSTAGVRPIQRMHPDHVLAGSDVDSPAILPYDQSSHWRCSLVNIQVHEMDVGSIFREAPSVDAKDTGRVVSILYLATLTVCLLTHIFFLSGNVDRYNGCSPFFETDNVLYNASSSQGTFFTEQPADTIAAESIGSHVIIAILVNRYFLLSIIILMALFMLRAQRYNKAFLKYVDHKALDINRLKQEMETDLKRLGKENKMLKMQLRSGLSPVGVNP